MRFTSFVIASAALLSTANAAIKGFNYGAQFNNDAAKKEVDFEYEFRRAQNLPGTDGWTNARLYTMIQHGTQNTVIEAIQAAINTKTRLLLGLWASAGQESFNNEITALKAAIAQYGTAFTDLVDGISVGSEDLYRVSPDGAGGNPGANPDTLVNYIKQTRDAIAGTSLSGAKLGHVDTWQVYVNASNSAVIDNLDWIGMDSYPYFQSSFANSIGNGPDLFFDSYNQTVAAAKGKPVWVTETAWPVSGETVNQGVPSADNARIYWEDVVCKLVRDNVNLYYYILQDVQWGNPSPSFGIMPGGDLNQVSPLFDLSCPNVSSSPLIPFPLLLLSSALSPLAFALLAHLSLAAVVLSYFFHTAPPGCSCSSPKYQPVHTLAWAAEPSVKSPFLTTEPTGVTAPEITSANPVSATLAPSGSPVGNDPLPSNTLSLQGAFEAPNLIVSIDTANPAKVLGNGYIAQLSPTLSSVFVFDFRPEDQGKTCNLAFHMPPPSPWPDMSPK
ncbi:hypothetical protein E8E13_009377 [Curvularia kusanoi]|uniref:Probable glucan endo-1,3-beta-glucosidase eglC n=1 Tax=Curvularia kusanoi TaxID=90978 RepID=A0A9P4TDL9_CURKU|nr:hypothetical protein E8E13_009377 [Curvularia kusanoi]